MIATEYNQDADNDTAIQALTNIIPQLQQAQTLNYTLAIGVAVSLTVAHLSNGKDIRRRF